LSATPPGSRWRTAVVTPCVVTLLVVALLVVVPAGAAAQAAPETAEQHFALGWKAYEKKDYKASKREFERATKLKKEYPEAYLGLALLEWAEDRLNGAIKRIDQALKYRPDYAEAHYIRGRLFYVRDDLAPARAAAETALKLNPKLYAVHALIADLEIAEGRLESGFTSFETARSLSAADFDKIPRLRERYELLREYVEHRKLEQGKQPGYVKPRILNRPRPKYTEAARDRRTSGLVKVLLRINDQGVTDRFLVVSGLPDGLTASAVRAASEIRAEPATLDGKPVHAWVTITVSFTIR
jgi:TonB family protein